MLVCSTPIATSISAIALLHSSVVTVLVGAQVSISSSGSNARSGPHGLLFHDAFACCRPHRTRNG